MNIMQISTVTVETLDPMVVACLRKVSESPELDGREQLNHWISLQGQPAASRKFGFDIEVTPEDEKAGRRGYEVWETIPENTPASDGIQIKNFPGGLYAVMTLDRCFDDPFQSIPTGWKDLHEWVLQSQSYTSAGHQWLEEVIQMEYGETLKLYHPVMDAA